MKTNIHCRMYLLKQIMQIMNQLGKKDGILPPCLFFLTENIKLVELSIKVRLLCDVQYVAYLTRVILVHVFNG